MEKRGVNIYLGTMERADTSLWEAILSNETSSKYIKGMGFQWAGGQALPALHQKYPELKVYQSEQECGDGKNDLAGGTARWQCSPWHWHTDP